MSRLWRPHVPLEVRCRVALRQLGEIDPEGVIAAARKARSMGPQLAGLLKMLADNLGCDPKDLRLDHDPPLGARPQFRRGLGKKTYYEPDANDPEHLIYREKHAHHIKTNVRGEHGQHPDRVLIKRERRRKRPERRKAKIAARVNPWPKGRKIESRKKAKRA